MTRTVHDPNPQLSWLDDKEVKEQIGQAVERALELSGQLQKAPPLSPEQEERERWQAESNEYAEANPLYAAARATSQRYAIVPLAPLGVEPLIDPSEATRDGPTILQWWRDHPEANVGVVVGRPNNLIALGIQDPKAVERLRELAAVERYDEDTDRRWTEYRPFESTRVYFVSTNGSEHVIRQSRPVWGRKALIRQTEALTYQAWLPKQFWMVWSYPDVISGMDAFNFPRRRVTAGIEVWGPGEVIPWSGSRFKDGLMIAAPAGPLSTIPPWVAARFGKPRSRKVMAAAREAYDQAQRATYGTSDVELLKLEALRERDRAEAATAAAKARAIVEREEPPDELPPVMDEQAQTGRWGKR
jgi:hypothetical protein